MLNRRHLAQGANGLPLNRHSNLAPSAPTYSLWYTHVLFVLPVCTRTAAGFASVFHSMHAQTHTLFVADQKRAICGRLGAAL